MTNKFRIDELVLVNGISKISNKQIKALGIIEFKDYYYNQYFIHLLSSDTGDWFKEKDIEQIMERRVKKSEKYKVALAIDKRGLDIINSKINLKKNQNKNNNILEKLDVYHEFKANKREYAILIWTETYWSENNFVVKIIEDTLKKLRAKNIAYQRLIVGITDPTYIRIDEFILNDNNCNVFNIFQKIEVKKIGGILT